MFGVILFAGLPVDDVEAAVDGEQEIDFAIGFEFVDPALAVFVVLFELDDPVVLCREGLFEQPAETIAAEEVHHRGHDGLEDLGLEINRLALSVIHILESFFPADVERRALRVVVKLFAIDLRRGLLQTAEQRLDEFVTDVADLERDGGEIFEATYVRHVLDVALAVVLVVILPLARLKSVVARIRPSEDVGEFELAQAVVVSGHALGVGRIKLAWN